MVTSKTLFQFYKLTSFNWNWRLVDPWSALSKFQFYKLTSFNWNLATLPILPTIVRVSILQTYILQLKPQYYPAQELGNSVSILQTYILQLKRCGLLGHGSSGNVSILQTYILQLKRTENQSQQTAETFQFYKLTSFNWNTLCGKAHCQAECFNSTNDNFPRFVN